MAKLSLLTSMLIALTLTPRVTVGQTPDDCGKFWGAKAVFIGKVVRTYRGKSRSYKYVNGIERYSRQPVLHVTLSVERAFTGFTRAGTLKPVEVECAPCVSISRPRVGESYLVYAYGAGSKASFPLATSVLTPVSEATAEIKSLEHLTAPGTVAYDLDRVGAGILSGKAISKPQPEYPEAAKAARVSGAVTVAIVLGPAGRVVRAEAVCGHPLLKVASEEAAKKVRYTPIGVDGKFVTMGGVIIYNFVIQ